MIGTFLLPSRVVPSMETTLQGTGEVGILQWLKEWFIAPKKPREGLGHPDLHPIDIEKLTQTLDLLGQAKELGQKGLPASDAKVLTGPEAGIVRSIERHRQGNVEWAVRRFAVLSESLSKLQVAQQVNQARQADQEFTRKASLRLADFEAQMKTTGEQARDHQQELERFRTENQLTRQSRHHTTARSFLTYALVAFFIVAEGVANAFMFSQGLDSGWLGGFFEAMICASINVLLAFVIGKFFVRQVFHRHWLRKVVGFAATVMGIVSIGFMALLITHYRDNLAIDSEGAAVAALKSLLAQPLAFADIFSVILCVLSVGFGVGALLDGLFSDDLYPGYGATSRRAESSRDAYNADLAEAREELAEIKEEALAEVEGALSRSQGVIASFANRIEDKRTTASRLETAMQDADHSLRALLSRFRTENEKHRCGVPVPPYFGGYSTLGPVSIPDFNAQISTDEEALSVMRTKVDTLIKETQGIRARIQASFSQQFDSLKTLDANFMSRGAP